MQNAMPNTDISRMQILLQAGLYEEAIRCGNDALTHNPHSTAVIKLIGKGMMALQGFAEAREALEVALRIDPRDRETLSDLGAICMKLGDKKAAIQYFAHLVVLNDQDPEAHYKLGLAFENDENMEAAVGCFGKAVELNPSHLAALIRMAHVCRCLKKAETAILAQKLAVDLNPEDPALWQTLGEIYLLAGKSVEAMRVFDHTMTLDKDSTRARCGLGHAALEAEQLGVAKAAFDEAYDLAPDNIEVIKGIALTYYKFGDYMRSEEMFGKWLAVAPDDPMALSYFAEFLYDTDRVSRARHYAERALEHNATNVKALSLSALIKQSSGEFEESASDLWRLVALDAGHASSYKMLLDLVDLDEAKKIATRLTEIAVNEETPLERRKSAYYGLARYGSKVKDPELVVRSLESIGRLVRDNRAFSILEKRRSEGDRIRSLFDTPPAPLTIPDAYRPTPIFILGMPRSGTTMTEQIVSNHSDVHGAGELPFLQFAVRSWQDEVESVTQEALQRVRDRYLEQIDHYIRTDCGFFTDKMPMNFMCIGHIVCALPEARIVHLRRTPEAVCWSNYKSSFGAIGLEYSHHQDETAQQYLDYEAMMRFWKERYADRIYDLHYEEMTEDPEGQAKALFDWLGLSWEPGVIQISENKRAIRTASLKQVRQDIYKGSSEEWRRYEPYIQTMLTTLRNGQTV